MNPQINNNVDQFEDLVRNEVEQQKLKHNNHITDVNYWLDLIVEETGEIAKAINNKSYEYALHEAIDAAAACKNFFECLALGLSQSANVPYIGKRKTRNRMAAPKISKSEFEALLKMPKGGPAAWSHENQQAAAAETLGNSKAMNPLSIYQWSINHNFDLLDIGPFIKKEKDSLMIAVLNDMPIEEVMKKLQNAKSKRN